MNISSSLIKKLAGYSAMTGAVLASRNPDADAQVIYHDIVPDVVIPDSVMSYDLDMNNDGITDFTIFTDSYSMTGYLGVNAGNFFMDSIGIDFTYLGAMGSCKIISSDLNTGYYWVDWGQVKLFGFGICCAVWNDAEHKFAPVILHLSDGNHYGWIRMTHAEWAAPLIIEEYAYEATPNTPISTPCVSTQIKNLIDPNLFTAFVENHQLIIHFHQTSLASQVILLNEVGMKLNKQAITQNEMVIDVSHLSAGIYFVEVGDGDKREVKKVLIQ